jgi:hypothetical protein
MTSGVPEQRGLSDARLASDDQDGALSLARVSRDPDARVAVIAGNANRPRDARWGNRKRRDAANARGARL